MMENVLIGLVGLAWIIVWVLLYKYARLRFAHRDVNQENAILRDRLTRKDANADTAFVRHHLGLEDFNITSEEMEGTYNTGITNKTIVGKAIAGKNVTRNVSIVMKIQEFV